MKPGASVKWILKRAVKRAALLGGRVFPRHGGATRILTYHSIGYRDHEMNVTPESFRDQMAWLVAHHTPVTLGEAASGRPEGVSRGSALAVTLDDGYRDNLTNAAPVLQQHGIPATVFVVVGRLGATLRADETKEADRLMTWDDISALESMGVQVGSHTMTHPRLAALSEEEQRREIRDSARLLEDRLGHPIEAFAYPFGTVLDYDDVSVRLVKESGFRVAVSNRYGANGPGADRWMLRRTWIDASDSMRMFRAKVNGELDALSILDSPFAARIRRTANKGLRVR